MSLYHLGRARGPWGSTADMFLLSGKVFVVVTGANGEKSTRENFDTRHEAELFMDDCEVINAYTTGLDAVVKRLTNKKEEPDTGAVLALEAASQLPIGTQAWLETYSHCLQLFNGARDAH